MTPELDSLAFAMPADADSTATASPAGAFHFKLPTFSTVDAAIWFRRAEVQFRLKKVTPSRTQADHVLAAIPDTLFPQMSTWFDAKGDDTIESTERRGQMILDLSNQLLGEQRPSEALTEMRSFCHLPPDAAGASAKIDILLVLWLRCLPDPVHAVNTDFDDDDLATSADSLLDAHAATRHPPLATAASNAPPDVGDPTDDPPDDAIAASSPA